MRNVTKKAAVAALAFACSAAFADNWPTRAITLVVPFAPGGNIDFTARAISDLIGKSLGQPVIVENRPGAGGVIGAAYVARAKPDGYTLLLGNSGPNAVANAVSKKVPYDGVKSFTVIGGITTNPAVLTISTHIPASNFAQFNAYAKGRAGGASVGTAGNGSFTHLAIELVRAATATPITVIPYKGTGPAAADLMGHTLDAMVDQITTAAPLIRDGRVKAIAQLGPVRSPLMPDVPTLAEQGFPAVDATLYTGLFAPAGLPPAVLDKLASALTAALKDPKVQQRYREMGAEPTALGRVEFEAYVAAEAKRWASAAQTSKVSIDD